MSDIIERAKAALRALDSSTYGGSAESGALQLIARENTFIREARALVPELVAEVERLHPFSRCPSCGSTNTSAVEHFEQPGIACHQCGYGT